MLFEDWNRRLEESSAAANDDEKKTKSTMSSSKLDTNSRNTLNTILYSNLRHRKQEIPRNYEVDEEAGGTIREVDITPRITPFTSDKSILDDFFERTAVTAVTVTDWSKAPMSFRYKLICTFLDDQQPEHNLTPQEIHRIKQRFRRNFHECVKHVDFDSKTKTITRIHFDDPVFR